MVCLLMAACASQPGQQVPEQAATPATPDSNAVRPSASQGRKKAIAA